MLPSLDPFQTCLQHVAKLGEAVMLYSADHDDFLPDAATWNVDIRPYVPIAVPSARSPAGTDAVFRCPAYEGNCGYGMNGRLSLRPSSDVSDWDYTILLIESDERAVAPRPGWRNGLPWRRHEGLLFLRTVWGTAHPATIDLLDHSFGLGPAVTDGPVSRPQGTTPRLAPKGR